MSKVSENEYKLWQELVSKYWPGGLTLVLPASDRVPAANEPQRSNNNWYPRP